MKKVLFLFLIIFAAGCHRVEAPANLLPGDVVELPVSISIEEDGDTRAVYDPVSIESVSDVVKNVWIIQFNGVSDDSEILGEPTYVEDFASFDGKVKVNLVVTDKESAIYFVANTFEPEGEFPVHQGVTLGELKQHRRAVTRETDLFGTEDRETYYPMFNGYTELDKVTDGVEISALLKRNIAKVNIEIINSAPASDALTIESISICSVPSISYYVTSDPSLSSPFPHITDFVKIDYDEIAWIEGENTLKIMAYLPVNMRGKSSSASPLDKNKYASDGSTFLQVSALYEDEGNQYPITYTFYLGEDMVNDYNLRPNNSYSYTFEIKGKGDADTDSRVADWGYIDFTDETKYELSNCYILNPPPSGDIMRSFRIPIKRVMEFWGDGTTANYADNDYYSLRQNKPWKCFVLASDFPIDETNFQIIKGEGRSSVDTYFEVAVAPGVRGNVIIGVGYNETDISPVSWSWHLWITDYNPYGAFDLGSGVSGKYIYPVEKGSVHRYEGAYWEDNNDTYIMDRNLGSNVADSYPSDFESGLLYYQFGRKDPFFQSASVYSYGSPAKVDYTTANENNGVEYSVRNPLAFIMENNGAWTKGNSYNPSDYNENIVWNDPNTLSGGVREGKKSLFDPCPPGYRLPSYKIWSDFRHHDNSRPTTNSFSTSYHDTVILDNSKYEYGFRRYATIKGMQYWPYTGEDIPSQVVYIPASGYLNQATGNITNRAQESDNGDYWSFLWAEKPKTVNRGGGYTSQDNHMSNNNSMLRARGLPVRCITDNQNQ